MKKKINYQKIKKDLILTLEAGVDETISETSRSLFDISKKIDFINNKFKKKGYKNENSLEKISKFKDIIFQQSSVEGLKKAYKNIVKSISNEEKNSFFGKGLLNSKYVLVFDCFISLFDIDENDNSEKRKYLLEDIVNSVKRLKNVSNDDFYYFSFFPIPFKNLNLDEINLKKLSDFYFLKYLSFLEAKKIIFIGNSVYNRLEEMRKIGPENLENKECILLPGLDLMLRAPVRKKIAWESLKKIF